MTGRRLAAAVAVLLVGTGGNPAQSHQIEVTRSAEGVVVAVTATPQVPSSDGVSVHVVIPKGDTTTTGTTLGDFTRPWVTVRATHDGATCSRVTTPEHMSAFAVEGTPRRLHHFAVQVTCGDRNYSVTWTGTRSWMSRPLTPTQHYWMPATDDDGRHIDIHGLRSEVQGLDARVCIRPVGRQGCSATWDVAFAGVNVLSNLVVDVDR